MKIVIITYTTLFFMFAFLTDVKAQNDTSLEITLDSLINSALHNNPELKTGQIQSEINNITVSKTKSLLLPNVSAGASYEVTDQNKSGNDFNTANGGINAIQEIYSFGKNKAMIEQSKFLYQAQLSNYNSQQQDIILQVKQQYFIYLKFYNLLEVAKSNCEQAELFLVVSKEKKLQGIGKQSDILKSESDLADARFILNVYENSIEKAKNELTRLTGLNIAETSILSGDLFVNNSSILKINPDSMLLIAKQNYPEIKALDNLIVSQEWYIKSVKAERLPEISSKAGYNLYYNPVLKDAGYWNVGLTMRWNIFDSNQKNKEVKIEELQKKSMYSQKDDLLLNLKKELDNQVLALKESYNQIKISETLLTSTSENLRLVEEEYRNGVSSMLELTLARTSDFNAKEKEINAWATYQISSAQIERILGIISIK